MALNQLGNPALPTFTINLTEEEFDQGNHLDLAMEQAKQAGFTVFQSFVADEPAAQMLLDTAASLGYAPKVVVFIEGGLVQEVISDSPVNFAVVDYDIEGADDDDIADIPQGDGTTAEAYRRYHKTMVFPNRTNEVVNDSLK
jgi:hypothetical protein